MAMAPEQIGIGVRRYFTQAGGNPYDTVEWEHRDARIQNYQGRHRRLLPARRRVPGHLVPERHQHRRPEVLPGHPRDPRARVVAAAGHRPRRRHDHRLGRAGRLLRRRAGRRRLPQRAQVHPRAPASRLQQPGVVQHRRRRRPAAGLRLLHPRRRGHDGRNPQLVPRRGDHLQGRLRLRDQPLPHPVVQGAPRRRRHGQRPGQLHARRRRVRRDHQERRQDAAGRQDGHPQRRPSRRRGVHLVQGARGAQGPRAARRRLRHGPRRHRLALDPVPERQQLGAGHRRVHASGRRGPATGSSSRSPPASRSRPSRPGTSCARSPRRRGSAPTRACSTTPPSTAGTPRPTPGGSTPATRARSTCTSTTRRATSPASTCCATSTDDGGFDVEAFKHTVEVMFTAQEILVGNADYPTERIAENSRRFRQLGLGYANLGALLMAQGMPYDSDGGRAWAAAITSLMTGHAYATSARTAGADGAVRGLRRERASRCSTCCGCTGPRRPRSTRTSCRRSCSAPRSRPGTKRSSSARRTGSATRRRRCSHPPGTIGLMMDCDTTGIEPDLALTKAKKLVGGGTMLIVNQTVPRALAQARLHRRARSPRSSSYIDEHKTIVGAPAFKAEHLPVFACSMGDNTIHYMGHIKMMAAVQPFISGAISQDREHARRGHRRGGRAALPRRRGGSGLKAVALYRDNCKVGQPLATQKKAGASETSGDALAQQVERIVETVIVQEPVRQKLPRTRTSKTFSFRVADCHGYATVGRVRGRPARRGVPQGRQAGLDPRRHHGRVRDLGQPTACSTACRSSAFVEKFTNMRFEPAGMTDDPDIRFATSLVDYIFRRMAVEYLTLEERSELGHLHGRRAAPADPARRRGSHHAQPAGPRHAAPRGPSAVGVGRRHPRSWPPGPAAGGRSRALLRLRRHHAAGRLVLRLPQLRRHQRLLLTRARHALCAAPVGCPRGPGRPNQVGSADGPTGISPRRVTRCITRRASP